ncbi:peptide-methionine (R)-S-oxide reductase MsrB [Galbitalea sp. SE-J8]|uniref:peptide-methionine (R)-S-oxide reductase MsrB n=1 Tax=Galbitalea sp. SE-J8 TaxID=3054952 RepID=UPI00259CDB52|nr:peptide-methionine (R)-S-oxide reductase MsrB [Galbitalea sp. SE-J8]MDM4763821.1 peptide-methionine (R)-S-oxide reductase MsrB [Galbitalea sp. SE-J8]
MTNERAASAATAPTDDELRERLTAAEYAVLREAATERAWSGELLDEDRAGLYACKACGNDLFVSGTKFDSGCGWPSFFDVIDESAVRLLPDLSLGDERTEVRCARCDSHLGHVFPDGFGTPTGDRYCMNSLALDFEAR